MMPICLMSASTTQTFQLIELIFVIIVNEVDKIRIVYTHADVLQSLHHHRHRHRHHYLHQQENANFYIVIVSNIVLFC